jgi:hypothetical protein
MYLVLPGVLFVFVFFDLMAFLLNKKKSESKPYFPDFKIWGIGFILGLSTVILSYFDPLKVIFISIKKEMPEKVASLVVIQQVAVMLFFLAIIGFILAAIVKITRDD